ncbi:calcium-activated potassium channel subunit beta-2 isoform X1 [Alligator sinensis]|uniref:Calcium-activated potassium channel subunit beta-2 n=2 Tax=Alligator sinensis TaxID=38654 RepID=A0A3Q0G154_ALLSI|nr:calcium-activated potassium channel subunit beta-2 isoform X1 [Alligator sinensis]
MLRSSRESVLLRDKMSLCFKHPRDKWRESSSLLLESRASFSYLYHDCSSPPSESHVSAGERSFHRPSTVNKGTNGQSSKMFIWTSGRGSTSYRHDEKRNIYQKIRDHDLLDKRKTVTALKAGEDRAILLGLAMMACSIMMYFLLGITLLRSYMQSVWTEEAQCTLLNASVTETFNCSFSCGPDCWKNSQYPCLQVYVNLTSSGQKLLLYHTEETMKINSECSYIPKCGKNYEESLSLVNVVMENFRKYQRFSCFYDPDGIQKNVILTKLYSSNVLFHSLFWPTCMMIGGIAIVAMVKLTQYLSLLCERIQRINR